MAHSNQKIIDTYFAAFAKQDMSAIREVMADDVTWYFMGRHPYAGVKKGIDQVVAFFNSMAETMGDSKPTIEKPIVCENENHLIECVHTISNRTDGIHLDHFATVLWTFRDGKIIEGRHFFADPESVDRYFTELTSRA